MAVGTLSQTNLAGVAKLVFSSGLGVPIALLVMLAMIVVPMPAFLLDVLFTFSIALALVVLLATVYVKRPLEFSVFPTVILLSTLLRLGLNIASTRVVLLEGHTGTAAAGHVIESFGEFVVGGNYAVGLVVFTILVIINFVVVTKGAGRVSEVSARFTLDAMPGKQMAIDADLNAGLITQEEAKRRRSEVVQEADFYGAMDGSSKFVRGDAIAGILILFVNIIGGLAIGMGQHGLPFAEAAHNYTLLTIGDGLVAQIPSLLLSTGTAIIVTRVSASIDMGQQVYTQLLSNPRTLGITGGVLITMGLIPGMPNFIFLLLGSGIAGVAYLLHQRSLTAPAVPVEVPQEVAPTAPPKELGWDDVVPVDLIGLEVGYRLIPLVDRNQGGQLMARIKGVRKKLSQELGFLVPAVHIRDNLELNPNTYRVTLHGVPLGEADIYPDREMAINPGQVFGTLQGIRGKDPAFGLEAVWIESSQREHAQTLGYTVVDAATVVATHMSQVMQTHAHELIGREEAQQLLNNLAKTAPKLVEELMPKTLSLGVVLKVLQNLLEEQIPIRDLRTIAETLADAGAKTQDTMVLTNAVRVALSRSIIQHVNGMKNEMPVITLDPALEQILLHSVQVAQDGGAGFEPGLAERIHESLLDSVQRQEVTGQTAILLVSPALRTLLAKFARRSIPSLHVLSFAEIPDNKQIKVVSTVGSR